MTNPIKHLYRVAASALRERAKAKKRSPKWRVVKKHFLEKNPACAACGSKKHLQVHHIKPFHLFPGLELEDYNLLSLCMSKFECHLRIGHGDDFRCFNPEVQKHVLAVSVDPKHRSDIEKQAKLLRQK